MAHILFLYFKNNTEFNHAVANTLTAFADKLIYVASYGMQKKIFKAIHTVMDMHTHIFK